LRQILLISLDKKLIETLALEMTQAHIDTLTLCAENLTTAGIIELIELISLARKEIRLASIPQLPLEIAVVKSINSQQLTINEQHTPPSIPVQPQTNILVPSPKTNTPATSQPLIIKESPETKYTTTAEPTATDTLIDIDTVKRHWQSILDKVRDLNSSLALTLGNCQPLYIGEGGTIILGAKFPMYKDKISAIENKLTVENAFDTILESKTKIKVVIDEGTSSRISATTADQASSLLTEAISILGGKIVA